MPCESEGTWKDMGTVHISADSFFSGKFTTLILLLDVNCTLPPFWEKAGLSNSNSGIVNEAASDLTTCLFKSCKMDFFLINIKF